MASNKELSTAIATICAERDVKTPELEGLNNSQLSTVLKDLKMQQPLAEAPPTEAPPTEAPPTEAPKEKAKYVVMQRKAITTKRGILSEGEEIKADDLSGGAVAFKAFVKSKHIGRA